MSASSMTLCFKEELSNTGSHPRTREYSHLR
jgi:hypothetical protein